MSLQTHRFEAQLIEHPEAFIFIQRNISEIATGVELQNMENTQWLSELAMTLFDKPIRALSIDQVMTVFERDRHMLTQMNSFTQRGGELKFEWQFIEYFNGSGRFNMYKTKELGDYVQRIGPLLSKVELTEEFCHTIENIPTIMNYEHYFREDEFSFWHHTPEEQQAQQFIRHLHALGYIKIKFRNYYGCAYVWYYNRAVKELADHYGATANLVSCIGNVSHRSRPNIDINSLLVGETDTHTGQTIEIELRWNDARGYVTFNFAFVWYAWELLDEPFFVEKCVDVTPVDIEGGRILL